MVFICCMQSFLVTIQNKKIKPLLNQAISTFFNLETSICCKTRNTEYECF